MSAGALHLRLRAATASAHAALEEELGWEARVATLDGYRGLLARLHGFHAAWEPAIGAALGDGAFFDSRRRVGALDRDLGFLGLSAQDIAGLPRARPIALGGAAEAMGALYVLEGSTLGGRVIGRHIMATHGLAGDGLAYYSGHAAGTGAMWSAFRTRLEAFDGDGDAVVAAANATFDAMRMWLKAP
ncbi:biliverdin-producing heme oxygenase [Methylobacterium sp. J-076]|uniref:biliverdin-producing heme oxygenase n=1 Tax=Methylobacterium sp. J-076 TaxID=2836655 RepID=UPI001FBAED88|nr:biliverdin-producing heme oxygenase [Methylobacterium sp. J-076]MCJ2014835.1 biliverdin-producing heme oxygenase [Methylobacterium sp. J-076]